MIPNEILQTLLDLFFPGYSKGRWLVYFYCVAPGGFLDNKESEMAGGGGGEGGSNGGPYLSCSEAANPLSYVAIILCVY